MFRYQILIEYVGTNFRGWQVQKKGKTIQGLVQEKISKLLKEKIILLGSGRTDTGVHAIEQSAHFDCINQIKEFVEAGDIQKASSVAHKIKPSIDYLGKKDLKDLIRKIESQKSDRSMSDLEIIDSLKIFEKLVLELSQLSI